MTQRARRVQVVVSVALASVLLTGCASVGPDYARPEMSPPAEFRDAGGQRSPETLADHRRVCAERGWSYGLLPVRHDIDTRDDWTAYLRRRASPIP